MMLPPVLGSPIIVRLNVCADDCSTRVTWNLLDDGIADTLVSTEREGERFHPGIEKLDLELSVGDRSRLSNQLIQALLGDRAVTLLVDIAAMACARRSSVDEHSKGYRPSPRFRPHD